MDINRLFQTGCLLASATLVAQDIEFRIAAKSTRYCLESNGSASIRVVLDLEYTNHGERPVILRRNPEISRIEVQATDDDGVSEHSVVRELVLRPVGVHINRAEDGKLPQNVFAVVEPGMSYQTIGSEIIVLLHSASGQKVLGAAYQLVIETDFWPGDAEPVELKSMWADDGQLLTTTLRSLPVSIEIAEHPTLEKCGLPWLGFEGAQHDMGFP